MGFSPRLLTMTWRFWLALLLVMPTLGPTLDETALAREPGQQRDACYRGAAVSRPLVVFRQDLADPDSLVLFYPVPAISAAPLIDPTNGRFALFKVEVVTRPSPPLPGEELVVDSCPPPASTRVRVWVVRADDDSSFYSSGWHARREAEPVKGVELCISTTSAHPAAAPDAWCDEVVTTEAIFDCPLSTGAAIRVGVLRGPLAAGPYLLVVEAAESPLQRLPEIVIPDRPELASCIQTGIGWYALPFRILGPEFWFRSDAQPAGKGFHTNQFPAVAYFKIEIPGGTDPYRFMLRQEGTDGPPDANNKHVMDLRRFTLLDDGRGVCLGAFLRVIPPAEYPTPPLPPPVLERWRKMVLLELERDKGSVVLSGIDRAAEAAEAEEGP